MFQILIYWISGATFGSYIIILIISRHKAISVGEEPTLRDSQSCTQINNICYIFGGQGHNDKLYNDMFTLAIDINETEKKFTGHWTLENITGMKPSPRTSHSCSAYKSQYLMIIGGEGYDSCIIDKLNYSK
jgi:hypothetical protein